MSPARRATSIAMVEHCWVLVGRRQGAFWLARRQWITAGERDRVEFDAESVLAREEKTGDVVGFYHTHPAGAPLPSQRDNRTMRAWVSAFGKPLLCLIESPRGMVAYRYDDAEASGLRLRECQRFPRGIIVVLDQLETDNDA